MATKQKNVGNKQTTSKKGKSKKGTKKIKKRWIILAAIVIALMNPFTVTEVTHQVRSLRTYDFGKEKSFGIDVSVHNGNVDWSKVSKEVDFAFIRVGYRGYGSGKLNLDQKARYNMSQAQKYGVPFGVYMYSQAITPREARQEARFLLKHIKGYKVELPIVYDFEYANSGTKAVGRLYEAKLGEKQCTRMAKSFCRVVKHAGYKPALYASSYIFKDLIKPKKLPRGTMVWVADYGKKVSYKGDYDIWQYSCTGKINGIDKDVDLNYWYQQNKKKKSKSKTKTGQVIINDKTINSIFTDTDSGAVGNNYSLRRELHLQPVC